MQEQIDNVNNIALLNSEAEKYETMAAALRTAATTLQIGVQPLLERLDQNGAEISQLKRDLEAKITK